MRYRTALRPVLLGPRNLTRPSSPYNQPGATIARAGRYHGHAKRRLIEEGVESVESVERNRLGGYANQMGPAPSAWVSAASLPGIPKLGGTMHVPTRLLLALPLSIIACEGRRTDDGRDSTIAQRAESTAAMPAGRESAPAGSPAGEAAGKEEGHLPATPTPTVTSENAITTMRQQLQQLDAGSVENLQRDIKEHSTKLSDLLTTMRVEVQAATSPAKTSWLASADTVDHDLGRLVLLQGQELKSAFSIHRSRAVRLLDAFRVLVPAKPE